MNLTAKLIAFEKVKKCIESCETIGQISNVDNLIDNFRTLYGPCDYSRALDKMWFEKLYSQDEIDKYTEKN